MIMDKKAQISYIRKIILPLLALVVILVILYMLYKKVKLPFT